MTRVSTVTRISISLACLTVTVVVVALSLGLVHDPHRAALVRRKDICETIAVYSSLAAVRGDDVTLRTAAAAVRARNPDILSLVVRRADGSVLVQSGEHERQWRADLVDQPGSGCVAVPIFAGDRKWGTVEVRFEPVPYGGMTAVLFHPATRLTVFIAAAGFCAYLLYLRRTLRYLDPSAVIPERVRVMLDTMVEPVLVLDADERVVLANQGFARLAGRTPAELLGCHAAALGWSSTSGRRSDAGDAYEHADARGAGDATRDVRFPWQEVLRSGAAQRGVPLQMRTGTHGLRSFVVNCAPIGGAGRDVRGALATFDDVTTIEEKNAQLRHMLQMLEKSQLEVRRQNTELQALANTDPLTKCLNRRALFERFEQHWSLAARHGNPLACVMVDVDHFKRINDTHGHQVGDQVLQQVAAVLKEAVRAEDVVSRYGGEEFCILLPNLGVEDALLAAERFRAAIAAKSVGGVQVTASLGVSGTNARAASPQEMLDQADRALYVAKRAGRNRALAWSPDTDATVDAPAPTSAVAGRRPEGRATVPLQAVSALMSALSYRDAATAEHSKRVADLCVATASGLCSVADRFTLEVAALLHDIGKLGVPDAILLKPGPLNEQEWAVMQTHDRMGVSIVEAAFASEEVTRIVRTHHAWYGGSPRDPGLPTGTDIPLGARILAIADAFDAIVSDRVYRKGRTREAAFAELRRCAGTQFDPELTERFIATVSATTAVRPGLTAPEQAVLTIGEEAERLSRALAERDITLLTSVANRLAATAGTVGLPQFTELAHELARAANEDQDLMHAISLTHELLNLCNSALTPSSADSADTPRPVQASGAK